MDIDDSASRCMVSVVSVTLVERLVVTATRIRKVATTTHREEVLKKIRVRLSAKTFKYYASPDVQS